MLTQLKPWTGSERLYFYPHSAQIVGQTGQIGRLRMQAHIAKPIDVNALQNTLREVLGGKTE